MGIFDDFSKLMTPHRESLEQKIGGELQAILAELRRHSAERSQTSRPTMYDKMATRPFNTEQGTFEIARSNLNEALLLQSIWIEVEHELEAEALPAYLLRVNQIPIWVLSPSRVLAPKEKGFAAEKLGGDLIVPRGSVLDILPALPGGKDKIKGAVTFVREVLDRPPADAGHGQSGEEYTIHNEHERDRDFPEAFGPTVVQDQPTS